MKFEEFLSRIRSDLKPPYPKLYCFDPGETTGFAIFENGKLKTCRQIPTKTIPESIPAISEALKFAKPYDVIICEDYRVYSWKADQHSWAGLHTPQLIGSIVTITQVRGLRLPIFQMAQQPKGFCTDEKLKEWGLYKPGLKHARDAIRHGCYYLLHAYKKDLPDHKNSS